MLNRKIAMALAAALVLAGLYGCSGSSSSTTATTPATPATPEPTAGPTVEDMFVRAQQALDNAATAGMAATDAVKAATENSVKLTTMSVSGESMTAAANAQAVLDAQMDAGDAVTDAQAALDDATEAKMAAEALDDGGTKTALIAALDAAIKEGEAQVKAATAERDGAALKAAVEMVTGDKDADPQGTPTSKGKEVAMDIGGALMPAGVADGGRSPRAPHTPTVGADVMNVTRMNNHTGMTWAEIVGADNLVDARIVNAEVTMAVKAMSVDGMTLTNAQGEGDIADGTQDGATYKGIGGMVFCNGADCKVEEVTDNPNGRKLVGSWYFTPTSPKAYYEKVGTATMYTAETNYAEFGHWLSVGDAGIVINTFAGGGVTGTTTSGLALTVNTEDGATTLTDKSATYSGHAAGISLHKEVDGNGEITSIYSGAFTAEVNLTAKFGDTPMLRGAIDKFTGNAADPDWRVTLVETAFADGTLSDGALTTATARNGEWTATAYGTADARPTGIFGGFNAHFSDGHAAGAYAAE